MKTIAVYPNALKDSGLVLTDRICEKLISLGAEVRAPEGSALKSRPGLIFADGADALLDGAELIVTVGGDGTILHAAPLAARKNVPLLGVNLGRVGFMAGVEPDELDRLGRLFDGSYLVEERMMLDVSVNQKQIALALNDAVVTAQGRRRLLETALYENDRSIGAFRGDGLIISTPTGSTAYSLSAGGPVVDPGLPLILAVPVCPHSLGARPIVFSPDAILGVRTDGAASLTVDGCDPVILGEGDLVRVTRAEPVTRLVSLKDRQFFTSAKSNFS
ncbi:MAG: NAD(+)/NADH kinase [Clostridia bacterium]|nr:NAD(+)/NADH kinase [Clostridia bacterium]